MESLLHSIAALIKGENDAGTEIRHAKGTTTLTVFLSRPDPALLRQIADLQTPKGVMVSVTLVIYSWTELSEVMERVANALKGVSGVLSISLEAARNRVVVIANAWDPALWSVIEDAPAGSVAVEINTQLEPAEAASD